MSKAKVVICKDQDAAKAVAESLKTPTGGGYAKVDGPFETDTILIATHGFSPPYSAEIGDTGDFKTWVVIGRPA